MANQEQDLRVTEMSLAAVLAMHGHPYDVEKLTSDPRNATFCWVFRSPTEQAFDIADSHADGTLLVNPVEFVRAFVEVRTALFRERDSLGFGPHGS